MSDAGGWASAPVDALQLPGASYYPESLGAASDGTLYVGSVATGEVVRFAPGQVQGTSFVAPGAGPRGIAGVLVDDTTKSLFVCAVDVSFHSAPTVQRYELATGHLAATFSFPGTTTGDGGVNPYAAFPNDMAFDASHELYVTDSFGGKVWRIADVSKDGALAEWAADASLAPAQAGAFGADGITWDGSGAFTVNNNSSGALVRIPLQSDGTAGAPVVLSVTPPLAHPDGQRQLDPSTLLVADNAGTLAKVALSGTSAAVTVIDDRLDAPTSVVLVGGSYWVTEGQITTSLLTGKAPNLPFLVERVDAY